MKDGELSNEFLPDSPSISTYNKYTNAKNKPRLILIDWAAEIIFMTLLPDSVRIFLPFQCVVKANMENDVNKKTIQTCITK